VVCVQAKGMKEAWCLATSATLTESNYLARFLPSHDAASRR